MRRLEGAEACRALLSALLVPPAATELWSLGVANLAAIVAEVPVYRMIWSLADDPFQMVPEAGVS